MTHPFQGIRNAIDEVYSKALADNDEPVHMAALTLLCHLNNLARNIGLPPVTLEKKLERA